jgi:hypothetical protein
MASRKEQKERLRAERLEAEQKQKAEEQRRRRIGMGVAIALGIALVGVIAVVVVAGGGGGGSGGAAHIASTSGITTTGDLTPDGRTGTKTPVGPNSTNLDVAAKAAGCKVVNPKDFGNDHVPSPDPVPKYKTDPPTSGPHDPIPQADGAYREEPEARHFVHSLEHGRIEIEYSPKLAAADQLKLKGVFDESYQAMLFFPNSTMKYEVATAAWDHYMGCPAYNDKVPDAIRAFRDQYRDRGPESSASQPVAE